MENLLSYIVSSAFAFILKCFTLKFTLCFGKFEEHSYPLPSSCRNRKQPTFWFLRGSKKNNIQADKKLSKIARTNGKSASKGGREKNALLDRLYPVIREAALWKGRNDAIDLALVLSIRWHPQFAASSKQLLSGLLWIDERCCCCCCEIHDRMRRQPKAFCCCCEWRT